MRFRARGVVIMTRPSLSWFGIVRLGMVQFALGAIFLPYIAVVIANVAAAPAATSVAPERALTAGGEGATPPGPEPESRPTVVRLQESPRPDEGA